ncbi:MAG: hypothetical protein AAFQ09_11205 [Pseudomonadota bacterium]
MTNILRLRARRFHALHALLTGEAGLKPLYTAAIPDHLSRDLGVPERIPKERPVTQLGIFVHSNQL